jgi:adenylate kinase
MVQHTGAVIFLGSPGSGKTTVANQLADCANVLTIETGRLLRRHVERGTELGRRIQPYLEDGRLAPTELVTAAIDRIIEQFHAQINIFDGFPRLRDEIDSFFQVSEKIGFELIRVFIFRLPPSLAFQRLTGRRICPVCGAVYNLHARPPFQPGICDRCGSGLRQRHDDEPEIVKRRINEYEANTIPVEEYFEERYPDLTREISASKTIGRTRECIILSLREAGWSLIPS